jgi:outer membrane receptor protein involved in Fe transport
MLAAALALLLTGTVVAPDGSPIAGATIVVTAEPSRVAGTGPIGEFTLKSVELPVDLVVSAPGFATARIRVTTSPVTITLLPRVVDASVVVSASAVDPGVLSLSREALVTIPAVTTDERLRTVAGFSLFRRSSSRNANPTTHGVTMRGLSASGASRGLVLLDGIPLNDGFGAWVTWTRVPAGALDRVDVTTGASGDLFGSDALGGVVQLHSAVPARPTGSLSVEGGSNRTGSLDVSGGRRHGRFSWFVAGSSFRSDGVVPLEAASRGAVDTAADAEWGNGFARVDVTIPRGRWSLYGFGGRDDRGNGTVLQRNRMSGSTVASSLTAATASTTFATRVSFSPNAFDQTFTAVATGRATEALTSTQFIDSQTTRAAMELGRAGTRGYAMVRGTLSRATAEFTELRAVGGRSQLTLRDDAESLSAQVAWTGWANVTVSAGGRQEWRAAPDSDARRNRARIGRAALEWRASELATLRASVATSHRWPTLNELVRGFRVGALVTNPNPDLLPERARTFEGGVQIARTPWRVGATLFSTVVQDAIVNVTVSTPPGLVRQRQNAGDAVATGIEFDGAWQIRRPLRVRGSLQLVDAVFENTIEAALNGKRLPQVPAVSGAASVDLQAGRALMSLLWRSTGHQFDDDRNTLRLASATQVDARAQWRTGRVSLFVVAENLLDGRIETGRTPLVTLAPGRAARVGVSLLLGDFFR